MSYARMVDGSDVYVFACHGGFECCACHLPGVVWDPDEDWHSGWTCTTRAELIAHLEQHQAAGHSVPARAFDRLRLELATGEE